ncbi:MAG: 2TM domain-containing protein [Halobacteriota archaeon]
MVVHGDGFSWFVFVLGFWGVGVVADFVSVFVGTGVSDRMAEREFERLKRRRE